MIDMDENMNDGKSYEYFASLGEMYPDSVPREQRPWDYAMKVDDDTFLHIPKLLERMRPLPRVWTWFVFFPAAGMINSRAAETKKFTTCSVRGTSCRGTS